MRENDPFRYAALGLVAGVALTVLFLLWAVPEFRGLPIQRAEPGAYAQNNPGPTEGHWWPELSARDTYAQWIAAIGGILVSLWAVFLVRNTLEETRKATGAALRAAKATEDSVEETRRLGEAQVRAYLTCTGGNFQANPKLLILKFKVLNTGQSPAPRCDAFCVPFGPIDGKDLHYANGLVGEAYSIGASREETIAFLFNTALMGQEFLTAFATNTAVFAQCSITWTDVFGERQSQRFFLIEDMGDDVPESERRTDGLNRWGRLHAGNHDPAEGYPLPG
jgi:hypothetical protein